VEEKENPKKNLSLNWKPSARLANPSDSFPPPSLKNYKTLKTFYAKIPPCQNLHGSGSFINTSPFGWDGRLRTSLEKPFSPKIALPSFTPPWLWYTVGLSGSGKSTWCAQQSPDLYSISTDNTREELTGSPEDHTKEAQVFELCFQRLRLALRQKTIPCYGMQPTFPTDPENIYFVKPAL
jgi:hypothetical protein